VNADWEHFPDLHDFIVALENGFAELQQAAERAAARATRTAARKRSRAGARQAG
jgi:hypothetical protein